MYRAGNLKGTKKHPKRKPSYRLCPLFARSVTEATSGPVFGPLPEVKVMDADPQHSADIGAGRSVFQLSSVSCVQLASGGRENARTFLSFRYLKECNVLCFLSVFSVSQEAGPEGVHGPWARLQGLPFPPAQSTSVTLTKSMPLSKSQFFRSTKQGSQ